MCSWIRFAERAELTDQAIDDFAVFGMHAYAQTSLANQVKRLEHLGVVNTGKTIRVGFKQPRAECLAFGVKGREQCLSAAATGRRYSGRTMQVLDPGTKPRANLVE
jgi:hypothetical protein